MVLTYAPEIRALAEETLLGHGRDPFNLLQMLIEVQEACHCVPQAAQEVIGPALFGTDRLRLPAAIRFYSFLSETYLGEYVIYLSDNITDQMQGSRALAEHLCSRLRVRLGRVRADGRVSVTLTSSTGSP